MSELFAANCIQWTVDEESALLSKSVYVHTSPVNQDTDLYWTVDYLHDRMREWGEQRTFFKWRQHFQHCIETSGLLSDSFSCHVHFCGRQAPPEVLPENVATSRAVLTYLFGALQSGRKDQLSQQIFRFLGRVLNRVCEAPSFDTPDARTDLPLDDGSRLFVYAHSGQVEGVQAFVSSKHKSALRAWMALWASMREQGVLGAELADDDNLLPLKDLMLFTFAANRCRKHGGKTPWDEKIPSGACLVLVQKGLINFMCTGLLDYVTGLYQVEHDVSKVPPARRLSGGGKVSMTADAVWEILHHASTHGTSAREALQVTNSRLSQSGGAHENSVDGWIRRRQIIYDDRAFYSVTGARHFNLVADGSCHSGKDVLVSVLWCHENETAVLAPIQVLLPGDSICAGEADLTSLVEQLAKERVKMHTGRDK